MKYQRLRGMHDILGDDAKKLYLVEEIARKIFRNFNYTEIKIPTIEEASLFLRTIGETSDIVEKQMYLFKDKGNREVALRPEGTASVVRAYIEHNLQTSVISKLFYCGSMFRYERPQEGRYREFYQIGCEYFGNPTALCEAEIINVAKNILDECGVINQKLLINSIGCKKCRPSYTKDITEYLSKIKENLCDDCHRRMSKNPLRVLDCKIDSPKLNDFPNSYKSLCDDCKSHFDELKDILEKEGLPFEVESRLVRGLDYYTGSVFEIKSDNLGAHNTIAAGGRYNYLVEELGGKPTPACGFALGAERLILCSTKLNFPKTKKIFIALTNHSFRDKALSLARNLRDKHHIVDGPFVDRSLKSQLNLAQKLDFQYVIIFGDKEFESGEVIIKDMTAGQQKNIKIEKVIDEMEKLIRSER